jgi:hypothetical protein
MAREYALHRRVCYGVNTPYPPPGREANQGRVPTLKNREFASPQQPGKDDFHESQINRPNHFRSSGKRTPRPIGGFPLDPNFKCHHSNPIRCPGGTNENSQRSSAGFGGHNPQRKLSLVFKPAGCRYHALPSLFQTCSTVRPGEACLLPSPLLSAPTRRQPP